VKTKKIPLFSFPFLRIVLVSVCSLCINGLSVMLFRDGIDQQTP
jgi:hypothetical protein